MELNNLPKTTHTSKKRVGHGYGSGRAKTCGRGTKGQKARGKVKQGFEGGQLPFIRRLPYKKGFKSLNKKPLVLNVSLFDNLQDGFLVNEESLIKLGLLPLNWKHGVKILGDGELTKKITVEKISCSKSAIEKIEKAGGKIL